jgi:Ca2+-binding EF-hand superfamily protein
LDRPGQTADGAIGLSDAPLFPASALLMRLPESYPLMFDDYAHSELRAHFDLAYWNITDRELGRVLAINPALTGLTLTGCELVDDSCCPTLAKLTKLERLVLTGTAITDAGVMQLRQSLACLLEIDLSGILVSDHCVDRLLTGCKRLHTVRMVGNESVSDKALEAFGRALASFNKLRVLDLGGCARITDRGMLAMLAEARDLQELYIPHCPLVTDLCLMAFASRASTYVELKVLDVQHVRINDSGLGWLAHTAAKLHTLNLSGCGELSDVGLASLGRCSSGHGCCALVNLDLTDCAKLTPMGLGEFLEAAGHHLQKLVINGCIDMDDGACDALAEHCHQLRYFDFSGASLVSNYGIKRLVKGCKKLETVHCHAKLCASSTSRKSRVPRLSDDGLAALGTLPHLRCVALTLCRVTDSGVEAMLKAAARRNRAGIRVLSFTGCDQLGSGVMQAVAKHNPMLEELTLVGTNWVRDEGVLALAGGCTHLTKLVLGGAQMVSDRAVTELAKLCPTLKHLGINGVVGVTDRVFVELGRNCKQLESVEAKGIAGVTQAALDALATVKIHGGKLLYGCPKLHTLRLSETEMDEPQLVKTALLLPCARSAGSRKGLLPCSERLRKQNEFIWERHKERVAAVSVQATFRAWQARQVALTIALRLAREKAARENRAVRRIQRVGRGHVGRRRAAEARRIRDALIALLNRSATRMQTQFRLYVARKVFKLLLAEIARQADILFNKRVFGVSELARIRRAYLGRLVAYERRAKCTRLAYQGCRLWRGYKGRLKARKYRAWRDLNTRSAIHATRIYRGYKGRLYAAKKKALMLWCAAQIQRYYRSYCARSRYHRARFQLTCAATTVELCTLGLVARKRALREARRRELERDGLRQAARVVERCWNDFKRRRAAKRKREREEFWSACIIGCRWRRFRRETLRAVVVQLNFRGYLGRRKARLQKKLVWVRAQAMGATTVQALAHHKFSRNGAALRIQTFLRIFLAKTAVARRILAAKTFAATMLQARCRGWVVRKNARAYRELLNAKAKIMQRMYVNWKNFRVWQLQVKLEKIRRAEQEKVDKLVLIKSKEDAFMAMVCERGDNAACRKIQRVYAGYIRKVRQAMAEEQAQREEEAAELARVERQAARDKNRAEKGQLRHKHLNPFTDDPNSTQVKMPGPLANLTYDIKHALRIPKSANELWERLTGADDSGSVRFGVDEKDMAMHSVLNKQTRLREIYGVTDIHITNGLDETTGFQREQTELNRMKKPYFIKVEQDLSHRKIQHIYLWCKHTVSRQEAFTKVEIHKRPVGGKITQQKRLHEMDAAEFVIVPHTADRRFPVELQCTRHKHEVGKAIKDMQVSCNGEQEHRLERDGYTRLEPMVGKWGGNFDVGVYIWELRDNPRKPYTMKKAEGVSKTEEYNPAVAPHYNEELEAVIDFLFLKDDEVSLFFKLFQKIDVRKEGSVFVDDICDYFEEDTPVWVKALFKLVEADPEGALSFSEFTHAMGMFCCFGENEMQHFAFSLCDADRTGHIDSSEFRSMIRQLGDNNPVVRPAQMERAFRQFDTEGQGRMDVQQFKKMIKFYPVLVYPTFKLQTKIKNEALGAAYWDKKKEQFMAARKIAVVSDKAEQAERLRRLEILKPVEADTLTAYLNPKQKKDLFAAIEAVDKRSNLALKFKRVFRELPKEQQFEVIEALNKVGGCERCGAVPERRGVGWVAAGAAAAAVVGVCPLAGWWVAQGEWTTHPPPPCPPRLPSLASPVSRRSRTSPTRRP